MSAKMDIDEPSSGPDGVEFHPLAIVHMSDQYTRITCGGSPLPKTSPVVGLLFGRPKATTHDKGSLLSVLDADDIPIHSASAEKIQLQVQLHLAVFPQHQVVGWYRVSNDEQPTPQDLETSLKLKEMFPTAGLFCATKVEPLVSEVAGGSTINNNCNMNEDPIVADEDKSKAAASLTNGTNNRSDSGSDDDRLITLYQLESNFFVALGDDRWTLETSEAEKIAVERVVREKAMSDSKSPYLSQIETVQEALGKMKERVDTLLKFLEDTKSGKIPRNYELLRRVNSLVCQLGAIMNGPHSDDDGEESFLQQVAVVTKTVVAIQGYTDKHRVLEEARVTMHRDRRYG